jgi:hypothetical protein
MKKLIFGFSVILLLLIPVLVLSAPSLASKLQGKILLAVEDKGRTYYVHSDGNRYQITTATAQKIFEKLALGIKNSDLNQIPLEDAGITPETTTSACSSNATATVCPTCPTCTVCDYTKYNELIISLKVENERLNSICSTNTNKETEKDLLNKEYGLKINQIEANKIELSQIKNLGNTVHMKFRSSHNYTDINADTPYKKNLADRMLTFTDYTSLSNYYMPFFSKEDSLLSNQIQVLQNELEKKLLEL